jgi:hypothetical protein
MSITLDLFRTDGNPKLIDNSGMCNHHVNRPSRLTWVPDTSQASADLTTSPAYPFGAAFDCSAEFWIMSILVPLGMALFHASNSQFLHLASRQKQFARMSSLKDHEPIDEKKAQEVVNSRWKRILNGVERADNIERTLIFIGIGMAVEVSNLRDYYTILV